MSANFLKLPSELRNRVYELCLLHHEPIIPWGYFNQRRGLTPELLRANKTVYREASSLLYTQNRFDFFMATPRDVASFLRLIGDNNANCIRHICVDFPAIRERETGNVTLEGDSDGVLTNIQSSCANLRTFTTSLTSTYAMDLIIMLSIVDNAKIVTEVLPLANTRLRAISSLQDIIVEVYEDITSDDMRRKMENDGWTISTIIDFDEERARLQDFRRIRVCPGSNRYHFRDEEEEEDDDDAYDIDNDSDFWRTEFPSKMRAEATL